MANRSQENRLPQWLLWLVGAATMLAAALMLLAVVLGIRAGQQQLEIQTRQQVGIHLQQAIDLRADGDLEAALAEYQRVLVLDPENEAAREGIESLFRMASDLAPAAERSAPDPTTPPAAEATSPPAAAPAEAAAVSPVASPQPTTDPVVAAWQTAQDAYSAGRWNDAVAALLEIQQIDPAFDRARITDLLYTSYVNLAAESDQAGQLEEALAYVDQALALRPDSTLRQARTMAAAYLDMLAYAGTDPARVVAQLLDLYEMDPNYRDVEDRLVDALIGYGDDLMDELEYCAALEQYLTAIEINVQPQIFEKRNTARRNCDDEGAVASIVATSPSRIVAATRAAAARAATPTPTSRTAAIAPAATPTSTFAAAAPDDAGAPAAETADEAAGAPRIGVAGPRTGRILYSATNPDDGRARIFAQPASGSGSAVMLLEDGAQPAMRSDGKRMVFYNTRSDMTGLSSYDPDTGLMLRFTEFVEDSAPSWSPNSNRIVFASNREGDRRWRIYVAWAEENGAVTNLGFGERAAYHPTTDQIVFKGCDETGNGCGLWTMSGSGGNRRPLTSTPADGTPVWSPDGAYVLFTSNERHGNHEIYRVDAGSGDVTRLTDNPSIDGIPAVSPDGNWVAFLSNRGGAWSIWAVPLGGGEAVEVAAIDGSIGNWLDQQIQWVN